MVTKTHNPVVAPMKSMKRNKSGQLGGMATSILSIGVAVIVLVLMLVIVQELRDTRITNTAGCNSTDTSSCGEAFQAGNDSLVGLGTFGDFVTIIVLALVAGIVLGIIFGVFGGVGGSGSGRRRK